MTGEAGLCLRQPESICIGTLKTNGLAVAERQHDWTEFFARQDRQRDARRSLIAGLPVDPRARALLLALDDLAAERGVRQPDGSMLISVPLEVLIWKLNRSRNTVRACIDSAGGTPYLAVTPSQHRSHTYLLRWPVIVDDSRPVGETTVGGCPQDAHAHAPGQGGGTPGRQPVRGSIRRPEGVNEGVNSPPPRGSTGGGQGGQFTPQPGLKNPGLWNSGLKNKNPGSSLPVKPEARPALEGVNAAPTHRPGFWQRWRTALAVRDLSRPQDVQELYQLAVAEGCCVDSEHTRLQVFAQAVHDRRTARTPKALFRENVALARWLCSPDDEDAAAELIAAVDGFTRGRRSADLLADGSGVDEERARQARALRAFQQREPVRN